MRRFWIRPQLTDTVESLCAELEGILVERGLYPDEASAMVRTWSDSWFEEGSRLIYIVPRGFVDHILPVTIAPAPAQFTRVFVGRLEIVTPATIQAVRTALAAHDEATLKKYDRFIQPILEVAKGEPIARRAVTPASLHLAQAGSIRQSRIPACAGNDVTLEGLMDSATCGILRDNPPADGVYC